MVGRRRLIAATISKDDGHDRGTRGRWQDKAQLSDEDVPDVIQQWGPGKRHGIYRHVATSFALEALKGVAADIFLANCRHGWGRVRLIR